MDGSASSMLTIFDLGADTIDHSILLHRPEIWFTSYPTNTSLCLSVLLWSWTPGQPTRQPPACPPISTSSPWTRDFSLKYMLRILLYISIVCALLLWLLRLHLRCLGDTHPKWLKTVPTHIDGGVNHARRQPARQEQSWWGVLLRDTSTL